MKTKIGQKLVLLSCALFNGSIMETNGATTDDPDFPSMMELLQEHTTTVIAKLYYRLEALDPSELPVDAITESDGTNAITLKMVYEGDAWMGVGLSPTSKMIGSEVVVGVPGSGAAPAKYGPLSGETNEGVTSTLLGSVGQTLINATIDQVNGTTTLMYTKALQEAGEAAYISNSTNPMAFAIGGDRTWPSMHTGYNLFTLNLTDGAEYHEDGGEEYHAKGEPSDDPDYTDMIDLVHEHTTNVVAKLYYRLDALDASLLPAGAMAEADGTNAISFKMVYDGDAWLGVGLSPESEMIGSEVVVGVPGIGAPPAKYGPLASEDAAGVINTMLESAGQTLINASIDQTGDGKTVLMFTKALKESGEAAYDITSASETPMSFAIGGDSSWPSFHSGGYNHFELDLSKMTRPDKLTEADKALQSASAASPATQRFHEAQGRVFAAMFAAAGFGATMALLI